VPSRGLLKPFGPGQAKSLSRREDATAIVVTNPAWLLVLGFPARRGGREARPLVDLRFEPGIDFEPTHLIYHITVRNPGDETIRDVLITPRVVHGPFRIEEAPRGIPVLEPQSFGTASFKVEPNGEPAEVELAGDVRYRVGAAKTTIEAVVAPMRLDLRPPVTRPVYLTPTALRERASESFSIQETLPLGGDAGFWFPRIASALEAEGLEKVEEKVQTTDRAFTGQASLYGLDRRGNSYAVRIVASRKETSTLRLLVFVQAEESLFGFFWRVRKAVQGALRENVTSHRAP